MLAILDYGAGNLTSVRRALDSLGIMSRITDDPAILEQGDGIIFPGVGEARQAMNTLTGKGLDAVLKRQIEKGQPLLGICLGCQILLDKSEESDTPALGILPGKCVRFAAGLVDENGEAIKIPHMGWNSLNRKKTSPLFKDVPEDAEFYFVHSYYASPAENLVLATTTYGHEFCSAYGREGLWAVQFHPEKSGVPGLAILKNFNDYCGENSCAI